MRKAKMHISYRTVKGATFAKDDEYRVFAFTATHAELVHPQTLERAVFTRQECWVLRPM